MTQAAVTLEVYEGNGRRRKDWTLDSDINGQITLADFFTLTKGTLIRVARQVLTEEQAKGFDKRPRVRVDNRFDIPEDYVSPLGKIEYFPRVSSLRVVLFAYDAIEGRSIVGKTKTYISSNWVFLNGKIVAKNKNELQSWVDSNPILNAKDKLRIVNLTPYGRKLENLGASRDKRSGRRAIKKREGTRKKKGRSFQVKIPNGAYQLAVRAIRSRFKSAGSTISFSYIAGSEAGVGGAVPVRANFRTTFKKGRSVGQVGRPYVYPSIVIRFSDQGILQ